MTRCIVLFPEGEQADCALTDSPSDPLNRPPRVLIAVPSLESDYGGPSAKAVQLAEALREHGITTEVVGCAERTHEIGLPPLVRFHSNAIPKRVAPLWRAIRRSEIVHVLGFREPVSTLSELGAILHRRALVVEPVGTHKPRLRSFRLKGVFDRTLGSFFLSKAHVVVATSTSEMHELIAGGVPSDKVRLRRNGVSVEGLEPLPDPGGGKRLLGLPEHARVILSLGRIIGIKGLTQIPAALAALPEDVCAVIAGPDERDGTVAGLRAEAKRFGVETRLVIRPEGVWGEEKRALLSDCCVFCLPSESESFGIGAAEAAILGIPVVASLSCGVVEWLDPDASATFSYGDVPGLVGALQKTLRPSAAVAATEARADMRQRLAWPGVALQQVAIYREALALNREAAAGH